MGNPLFSMFHGMPGATPPSGQFQNMTNMLNQFNQFRAAFSGNPKKQVEQLMKSGRMSQAQYDQLAQMASELQKMMK